MKPSELLADESKWFHHGRKESGDCIWSSTWTCYGYGSLAQDQAEKRLLAYFDFTDVMQIYRWNDAPERTHAEVLAVLRACNL